MVPYQFEPRSEDDGHCQLAGRLSSKREAESSLWFEGGLEEELDMGEKGVGRLLVVDAVEEGVHGVLLQVRWTQSAHSLQSWTTATSEAGDTGLEGKHVMQLAEEV